jgi:hypothetical protein
LFRLRWFTVHHIGPPGKQRQVDGAVGTSKAFRMPPTEHTLELVVGPSGLEEVLWGEKSIPELRTQAVFKPPEPPAARGVFGVYLSNGNGICRKAQFQFNEEK